MNQNYVSQQKSKTVWEKLVALLCTLFLALLLCGCTTSSSDSSSSSSKSTASEESTSYSSPSSKFSQDAPASSYKKPSTVEEVASKLGISTKDLWYNASNKVGKTCTVTGPVTRVYRAMNSKGQPTFIDIGPTSSHPEQVTLVVWNDAYYEFAEMINEVDDGNAWLSVTSKLVNYKGALQMNSNNSCNYQWWTSV